jgi:isopentenyl-diphosphate delta-isomerase
MAKIQSRKEAHVRIAAKADSEYLKSAGFENIEFVHCSLPEIDLRKVSLSTSFLGRKLSSPLAIEGMTGGYPNASKINRRLAQAANGANIIFGLGSQRAMLKHPELAKTYKVRDVAPDVFLIGNLGAVQLREYSPKAIEGMLKTVDANALALHLNPLQEAVQPEGDLNWAGVLHQVRLLCDAIDVPVIAKETGAGISAKVALQLKEAGVSAINVSGSGGTSWSRVEYKRGKPVPGFEEWGIPTAISLAQCSGILPLIASGGIRNGIDAAKSIALGADISGAARPFLISKNPLSLIREWEMQLRTAMFLTGSKDIAALKRAPITITGRIADSLSAMGLSVVSYFRR